MPQGVNAKQTLRKKWAKRGRKCWGGLPQSTARLYVTTDPATLVSGGSQVHFVGAGGIDYPFFCFAYIDTLKCVGGLRTEFKTDSRIRLLSAGHSFACVADEASLWCWNRALEGWPSEDTDLSEGPQKIEGVEGRVDTVGFGQFHLCFIADGDVWCRGYNRHGQLGDGTKQSSSNPVRVKGLKSDAVAIAAGSKQSCAAMDNGKVYCWGWVYYRNSGDGRWPIAKDGLPHEIADLPSAAISLVAAQYFTCALLIDGEVYCWGDNLDGELVPGKSGSSLVPLEVSGIDGGASAIAAGKSHACAVLKSGGVKCWGDSAPDGFGRSEIIRRPVEVKFPR